MSKLHWEPRHIGWRSSDWKYTVAETYSHDGVKYRAAYHVSALNVRPLGEIRATLEEAKADAQAEADRVAREAA